MVSLYVNTVQQASIQLQELTSALSARQEKPPTATAVLFAVIVKQASNNLRQVKLPVLFVGKENILLGQAGVIVQIVRQASINLRQVKLPVLFVGQENILLGQAGVIVQIVLKVNTNPRRARLLVSSVKKVKTKWGQALRFAILVVWASTSPQQAKLHVSTVLKENLQQKQKRSNVLFVWRGHIRMNKGSQDAKIVMLGSFRLPL
jgi:hypothetical protein